jgi:hypothetical protein
MEALKLIGGTTIWFVLGMLSPFTDLVKWVAARKKKNEGQKLKGRSI